MPTRLVFWHETNPPCRVQTFTPLSSANLSPASHAQLEALMRPEYKDMYDKYVLQRYTRGYTLRSYVNAPDRVERAGDEIAFRSTLAFCTRFFFPTIRSARF
jgi:hypothetical protein